MMTAALLVPGVGGRASAQDANWCTVAESMHAGSELYGYTVVEFTGGAGNQVVLGSGDATLSGGSGNDVLVAKDSPCNAFYGGSGNDTVIGYGDDWFDGGSGRNVTELSVQDLWISGTIVQTSVNGFVTYRARRRPSP